MATPTRFALLVFVLVFLPARWLFLQQASAQKQDENGAGEQMTAESKARFSRTHCEVPDCVQKVLYFSNLSQPTDFQDVVNVMRAIADIQRVQQLPTTRIIIIEGTAEQVVIAEKLAAEIDKARRRFGGLGYRVDLRIQESEGEKKLRSRLYSFVTDTHDIARLGLGRQPSAQVQNEPAPENKQSPELGNTRSIECRILAENERTLEMNLDTAFASDTTHEGSGGAQALLRVRVHVTVELDKPTVISRIDDPDRDRSFTLELTASRIKEKS